MKMDLPMMGVLFLLICVVIGRMMLVKQGGRSLPSSNSSCSRPLPRCGFTQ